MLVARRDPMPGQGDRPLAQSRLPRVVTMLQMAGTLVGIPVALASGYSVYHANFSPEAVCQGLRANIVSVLDKSADAATLRALVRRDVISFEQNCKSVDPDAVAAFKSLLAVKPAVARTPAPQPRAEAKSDVKIEPRPEPKNESRTVTREAEPRREPARQATALKPAAVEKQLATRDATLPDDKWIEAVRGALVTHDRARPAHIEQGAPPRPLAPPQPAEAHDALPSAAAPMAPMSAPASRKAEVAPPPPEVVAPALAPPVAVAPPVAIASPPVPATANHPVPPAAIPDPAPTTEAAAQDDPRRSSRFGAFMSHIPVLNRVWGEEQHED